jgi:dienelactone hydrolase
MLPAAAAHFDTLAGPENYRVPPGTADWAGVQTSGHLEAPVGRSGALPVVLYSPGLADPRTFGTTDVEDLASRGYLVVTIDHTYEASEVAFPGGRLETSLLPEIIAHTTDIPALLAKIVAVRVADTRFVLDALGQLSRGQNPDADHRRLPPGLTRAPDLARVGMYGHSGGGFTALQTMHDDARIRAAVDMDGQLSYGQEDDGTGLSVVVSNGLTRPFLLMGSADEGDHTKRPSWQALWNNSRGPRADRTLPGSKHGSFTDAEALLPKLGLPAGLVADQIGTANPATAISTQRNWLASFFDRTL